MNVVAHFTALFFCVLVAFAFWTNVFGTGVVYTAAGWGWIGLAGFFGATTIGAYFTDTQGGG